MIVIPPSLAAGWAVSKFSKKFRQPVNAAMAAVLVKVVPMLGEVKVTPLVTGLVMGDKDKQIIVKQVSKIDGTQLREIYLWCIVWLHIVCSSLVYGSSIFILVELWSSC